MPIKVTPDLKLKRPTALMLKNEHVNLFRHEKGSTYCVVEKQDGTSAVAALCDLDLVGKARTPISSKVKPATPAELIDKKLLDAFFLEMGEILPPLCENCSQPLNAFNRAARRAMSCHILPKSIFEELATDPDNIVFMGVVIFGACCNDHTEWDSSVEKRILMPIYPRALKQYKEKLRPQLSEAKQQLADEYMGVIVKSTNLYKDLKGDAA